MQSPVIVGLPRVVLDVVMAAEHYSVDEYLSFERASVDVKHEYLDGLIVAMAGATRAHNLITGNIVTQFVNQLRGSACETYSSNMRVRTTPTRYTYPDVVVVCEEPQFEDGELDTLLNPSVVVEVLSPSTTARVRAAREDAAHLKGLRLWRVPHFEKYLIVYRPARSGVEVIRVLHGARNVEKLLGS